MTIDRQNPIYYWKGLRLADYARFGTEGYGLELESGDWRLVGNEQDKRQLFTKGAQALYSHTAELVFIRGGAEISGTKEHAGEEPWEFRNRIRDFLAAFAAKAALKSSGMNHAGILGLSYAGELWHGGVAITAGSSVAVTFSNNPVLTGLDLVVGQKVLWVDHSGSIQEIVEIESLTTINQATFVSFANSYTAGDWWAYPLDWGVAGAWPEGELNFQRGGSSDVFTAQVRFRFAADPEESY